uniref:Uncharacterized protein n=1 Tax=Anopheles darlingi TaxID=43151 RepID=A0A2M4D518_ANODA
MLLRLVLRLRFGFLNVIIQVTRVLCLNGFILNKILRIHHRHRSIFEAFTYETQHGTILRSVRLARTLIVSLSYLLSGDDNFTFLCCLVFRFIFTIFVLAMVSERNGLFSLDPRIIGKGL